MTRFRRSHPALLLTVLVSLAAVDGTATPWPSWRGPNSDQTTPDTGFPLKWNATNQVRWKASLPEAGNSSPVVWGDRVFLTQSTEEGRHRDLIAFDRKTGKQVWKQEITFDAAEPHYKSNPHSSASPVTDGEHVVASFGSAGVVACDVSGKLLWRRDLGPQRHDWGQGSSPILDGDQVLVYHGPGAGSSLHALDLATGATRWTVPLPEERPAERFDGFAGNPQGAIGTFSTPLVIQSGGRKEVLLSVANRLHAFAPKSGAELWSVAGMNPLVYGSPTFGEGKIVAIGGFFGAMMILPPGGSGDRTAERSFYERRMKRHTIGSPVIHDGYIYLAVTDGFLQCYRLSDGGLVWEERIPSTGSSGQTWASMVRAGDRLYAVNQSGDTVVFRAAPKFEVLAVNPLGELSNSTPAFSDGDIFLRTESALWCVSGKSPQVDSNR